MSDHYDDAVDAGFQAGQASVNDELDVLVEENARLRAQLEEAQGLLDFERDAFRDAKSVTPAQITEWAERIESLEQKLAQARGLLGDLLSAYVSDADEARARAFLAPSPAAPPPVLPLDVQSGTTCGVPDCIVHAYHSEPSKP